MKSGASPDHVCALLGRRRTADSYVAQEFCRGPLLSGVQLAMKHRTLGICFSAYAVVLPMPLVQAITAAETHATVLSAKRAELRFSQARNAQSLGPLLPQISGTGSIVRNSHEITVNVPRAGGAPQTAALQPLTERSASFAVSVKLFDPVSWMRRREANSEVFVASASLASHRAAIQLDVARAYCSVTTAQEVLNSATRALDTVDDAARIAAIREDAGAGSGVAVAQAKADRARVKTDIADAEYALAIAVRQLATLTGTTVHPPLPKIDPRALPEWNQDDSQLLERAMARRQDVESARQDVRRSEAAVATAWAAFLPVMSASAVERYTNATGFSGRETSWSAGLTATLQLEPYSTTQNVRAARADADAARARLEALRDSARDELHAALASVRQGGARVTQQELRLEAAREVLSATMEKYRLGFVTPLELSQAESAHLDAEVGLANASSELALAKLTVIYASGDLLTESAP